MPMINAYQNRTCISLREVLAKDKGKDGHQLNEDIETGSRSIFERISHCISHNCGFVDIASFTHNCSHVSHQACFNVFLRVIPRSSCVRGRNRHLNAAHDGSWQETDECFGAKEEPEGKWCDSHLNKPKNTSKPGLIRSLSAAFVLMRTQALQSGAVVPSRIPGFSLICLRTSSIMPRAAWPTDLIAMALKAQGIMAPKRRQVKTRGSLKETSFSSPKSSAVWRKAPQRANPTRVAEPIAKPFPIAAVVFPAESSTSVRCLTTAGSSAISAIPPALSLTGPQLSMARQMGRFDSMPSAARATPQKPSES